MNMGNETNKIYSMDDILGAGFGEVSGKIVAKFRKSIMIKDYHPEEIELTAELDMGKEISGMDRVLITSILEAQLECSAYMNLLFEEKITQAQYDKRIAVLTSEINVMAGKYTKLTGKSADEYLTQLKDRV